MTPRELVHAWVGAFNHADVDALTAMFTEDTTNYQVAKFPVMGRAAISQMFEAGFAFANMEYTVEQVLQDGEWAALEWRDPLGLRGCGFFQVRDSRIVFQRGYLNKLNFLRAQGKPIPDALQCNCGDRFGP